MKITAVILAIGVVANAAPDGYTLLLTSPSHAINVTLYAKLPYDAVADFVPITQLVAVPNILVIHPALPARPVKELIALAVTTAQRVASRLRPALTPLLLEMNDRGDTEHRSAELARDFERLQLMRHLHEGECDQRPHHFHGFHFAELTHWSVMN